MTRIINSIWGHVRLLAVHARLHIGGDKDKTYKIIVAVCMVLMAAGLPLLITVLSFDSSMFNVMSNNYILVFLYWVFYVHMATLGFVSMAMMELSWYIAHTYCNKVYPEQASKYERQLFHGHTAP